MRDRVNKKTETLNLSTYTPGVSRLGFGWLPKVRPTNVASSESSTHQTTANPYVAGLCYLSYIRQVKINGDKIGEFESKSGSIVTSLGIQEDEVHTVTLESVGIGKDEWISLLEVSCWRRLNSRLANAFARGTCGGWESS